MDAVDNDGQVFIGYWAMLRWGLLSLHYHGYLHKRPGEPVKQLNRFRRSPSPVLHGDRLVWQTSCISTSWQRRTPSIRQQLLTNAHGTVDWFAVMPSASVMIQWQDGSVLTGLGYVEQLEMTIPPWNLPIQRLHWGRAINDNETVVWIRWESNTAPFSVVYHANAGQVAQCYHHDLQIEEDNVVFGGYHLMLQRSEPLRSGIISETVFQQLGWLKWIFPQSIRQLQETKWLSRGLLEFQQNTSDSWGIHEVVDWS